MILPLRVLGNAAVKWMSSGTANAPISLRTWFFSSFRNSSEGSNPLPNVTNTWQRVGVDLKYFFTSKLGIGLSDWYEKLDVTDYATIDLPNQPGTPRVDYLGEISTGYGNRPYKGNSAFARLLVLF